MPKRWLIRGILACAAFLGSVRLAEAQSSYSSSGAGMGASGSSGSGIGQGTSSGQAGGIQSLGTVSNSGKSSSTTNTIPSASNPYSSTYANPYAAGLSGVSTAFTTTSTGGVTQTATQTAFGQPVYATKTTGQSTTSTTGANTTEFNTLNIPKTPPYATVLGDSIPLVKHAPVQLQGVLLNSLSNAPFLNGKPGISLAVDGSTVILKGQVANANERRVVEGLVRLTPGVRNVVNELVASQQ